MIEQSNKKTKKQENSSLPNPTRALWKFSLNHSPTAFGDKSKIEVSWRLVPLKDEISTRSVLAGDFSSIICEHFGEP